MHPSLIGIVKKAPNKEPSGSISSPSAASSGYGSSAEDESSISPYNNRFSKHPFDFPQDPERKKTLDEFDTLCLLSEPFLEDPKESFALVGQTAEPTLADDFPNEVFEIKSMDRTALMFQWHEDVLNPIGKLECEASFPPDVATAEPPSSVDFFTEFFNDCSTGAVDACQSERPSNIESIDAQGQMYTSSLSSSNVCPLSRSDKGNISDHSTPLGPSDGPQHGISMLSDLNEIDDMFNFVLDGDENLFQGRDSSREKVFHPFEALQCHYDPCKSELQSDYQKDKYDDLMRLSPILGEEMRVRDLSEFTNKRKRQSTFENDNPSKSQKQESFQDAERSDNPLSSADFKFQSLFDSIPLKEDLTDLDNLNFAQENNRLSVDAQITKDTFLSNFTFQINETDGEEVATHSTDVSPDDVKALFNAPLDVGEIFSNLQFADLHGDGSVSEDVGVSNECVNFTPVKSNPISQQSNCSYFIIAVPTSLNSGNITSCIVVKPNSTTKNVSLQGTNAIKREPQDAQKNDGRSGKSCQTAIKQEIMKRRNFGEDRGNVLQTILTCGAINFNANQGSDAIYEGIIRGQLTQSSIETKQQNKTQTSLDRQNLSSANITKGFKSDTGSVKGSNILQRLLKGQMHERDVYKRPAPASLSSSRHVAR